MIPYYIDATITDIHKAQLVALLQEHFTFLGNSKTLTHIQDALQQALYENNSAHFLGLQKSETNDTLVGFCFFNLGVGIGSGGYYIWLNDIHIEEDFRGQGGGTMLLNYLLVWAKTKEVKYIAAMAHKHNQHSQNLFKKMGFGLEEVIWMDKAL